MSLIFRVQTTELAVCILFISASVIGVGLEKTVYEAHETDIAVEVCVVRSPTTNCSISFPFDVSLWTEDDIEAAGNLTRVKGRSQKSREQMQ